MFLYILCQKQLCYSRFKHPGTVVIGGRRPQHKGGGMTKYVVAKVDDIAPGARMAVTVRGRPIVISNLDGALYGMMDRCPHQGAGLSQVLQSGLAMSSEPGTAHVERCDEFIRCPWHGWEFDIKTGQSWFDPNGVYAKSLPACAETGDEVMKGPFKAEMIEVSIDENYVVVEI